MANIPCEINRVLILGPIGVKDELHIAKYTGGYQYKLKSGFIETSTILNPVYRYGKQYNKHNNSFNLCVYTLDNNDTDVEKYLDGLADKLDRQSIIKALEQFYYLDYYYGETKS